MHPLVVGFKRAHWAAVRVGLRELARLRITPARFEYLYVLGRGSMRGELPEVEDAVPMTQARLRQALGVSRTTVSRMLRVLEGLGLVTRRKSTRDARTRVVCLTALGLYRLAHVLAHRIGPKVFDRRFCSAMRGPDWRDWREGWRDDFDGRAARRARGAVATLRKLARAVGDFATSWRWREYLDDPSLEARADREVRRSMLGEALAKATELSDCPVGCGAD